MIVQSEALELNRTRDPEIMLNEDFCAARVFGRI